MFAANRIDKHTHTHTITKANWEIIILALYRRWLVNRINMLYNSIFNTEIAVIQKISGKINK